ncbi:hypothetical protein B0H14DRAFT_2588029 [Mycena olivaceomarginata]|nr:hypothetical protein B0H14DRAFT_2588029 [Mycena olivaceomarginata]
MSKAIWWIPTWFIPLLNRSCGVQSLGIKTQFVFIGVEAATTSKTGPHSGSSLGKSVHIGAMKAYRKTRSSTCTGGSETSLETGTGGETRQLATLQAMTARLIGGRGHVDVDTLRSFHSPFPASLSVTDPVVVELKKWHINVFHQYLSRKSGLIFHQTGIWVADPEMEHHDRNLWVGRSP